MSKHNRNTVPQEISWPVGPDATYRAPMTDPQGSYTGRPLDPMEEPVQDVDDL